VCGGVHDVLTGNQFHQHRSRGFRATGSENRVLPLTWLVALTTVQHYSADCDDSLYAIRSLCVCLSYLSVTLVYCGQTVGWIKIKFGMDVGLVTGHIVLDGDAAADVDENANRWHFLISSNSVIRAQF